MSKSAEEEYDRLVWQFFQTSKKFNRKATCYLCGKETPSGSGNVLLHLRHHHPEEHTKVVDQVAREQLRRVADRGGNEEEDPRRKLASSEQAKGDEKGGRRVSEAQGSSDDPDSVPMVAIKKETLQIKME